MSPVSAILIAVGRQQNKGNGMNDPRNHLEFWACVVLGVIALFIGVFVLRCAARAKILRLIHSGNPVEDANLLGTILSAICHGKQSYTRCFAITELPNMPVQQIVVFTIVHSLNVVILERRNGSPWQFQVRGDELPAFIKELAEQYGG
ncbi:MAG: hypothetical protein Greene041662_678 [Candidatus Peregrinibacteria bacterium Greene0416_62]|nr:MAG: hypothetical protein Greene041662_678 [Candidatus Peregrinibacteria bacterium Greene0416_62]TSC98327.1 MAG: hypothetical protein Greene101449_962 [Candidatus Peregrinibacteria bacterium Greene1014_49]